MNLLKSIFGILVISISSQAMAQGRLCLKTSSPSATKLRLCPAVEKICVDNYSRGEKLGDLSLQLHDGTDMGLIPYRENIQNNMSDVASEVGAYFYDKNENMSVDLMYESDRNYPHPVVTGDFYEMRIVVSQGVDVTICSYSLY